MWLWQSLLTRAQQAPKGAQETVWSQGGADDCTSSDHSVRLLSLYNRRYLHFRSLGFVFTVEKFWQGSPFNGMDTAKKKKTLSNNTDYNISNTIKRNDTVTSREL